MGSLHVGGKVKVGGWDLPDRAEDAADCPARCGYFCTRDRGHDGPHVAHGRDGIIAFWLDEWNGYYFRTDRLGNLEDTQS